MRDPWWKIRCGWRPITADDALSLDLDQAARWQWEIFEVSVGNYGIGFCARAKPNV